MLYIAYDTETNGLPLNPLCQDFYDVLNWPRVYQIGAIVFDEYGIEYARMNELIRPDGWKIPELDPFLKEMGEVSFFEEQGIDTEYLMDMGSPISKVLPKFIELAEMADERVAHNAAFDNAVMTCEFFRLRHFPYHWQQKKHHCTKLLSMDILKIPGFKGRYAWPTLQEAHKHFFGYDFDGAHDAMADVEATMNVFLEILNEQ